MKKLLFPLILFLSVIAASAQDVKHDRAIMQQVQADFDHYLFASASADSLDQAKASAIRQLASQILTDVKGYSNYNLDYHLKNGDIDETVLFKQVSETFTDVRLSEYQPLVVGRPDKKNNKYTVFVYIDKAKVKEIYQEIEEREMEAQREREEKLASDVRHYYSEGCNALKDVRLERGLPQEATEARRALGVRAGSVAHCAELEETEGAAAFSRAFACVQHGASHRERDRRRDSERDRHPQRGGRKDQKCIQKLFHLDEYYTKSRPAGAVYRGDSKCATPLTRGAEIWYNSPKWTIQATR